MYAQETNSDLDEYLVNFKSNFSSFAKKVRFVLGGMNSNSVDQKCKLWFGLVSTTIGLGLVAENSGAIRLHQSKLHQLKYQQMLQSNLVYY